MITKTPAFQTEDGTTHLTIEAAQRHELVQLSKKVGLADADHVIPDFIMESKDAILAILTTKARKPRAANGKPRGRKRLPLAIKSDKAEEAAT